MHVLSHLFDSLLEALFYSSWVHRR